MSETLHTETYRGKTFSVVAIPEIPDRRRAYLAVDYGHGPNQGAPKGDLETAIKKIRAAIDLDIADREILPRLTRLIGADLRQPGGTGDMIEAPEIDQVVWVSAMGRWRRGLVTKVTKTRATVAYTTASSGGRVFRKADYFSRLLVQL